MNVHPNHGRENTMAITAVFETPGMTQQLYEKTVSDLAANGLGSPTVEFIT